MATLPASPETISNPWTSSAAASHARISAKPGSESVSRELAAVFGLSTPVWFGNFDLDTCSLRTSQGSLFQTQCEELSENWPDSGMWDAGAVYELQNSEPVTCESESSLWRTPNTRDHHKQGPRADAEQRQITLCDQAESNMWPTPVKQSHSGSAAYSTESGRHAGTTLTDAIRMWPTAQAVDCKEKPQPLRKKVDRQTRNDTPGSYRGDLADHVAMWPTARAEDSESCGNHPGAMDSLTGATRNWPTPNVPNGGANSNREARRERTGKTGGADLQEQIGHWKTPHGMSNVDFRGKVGGCGGGEFAYQADNWVTPNARDWKSETGSENNNYDKTPNLSRQVYRLSPPAPVIPDGPASSENVQTSRRRLNPRFVEWLMGFPISWTEL